MLKIGLTGGIGSGKSTIAALFNVLGIPVFDADQQARMIMETDENLVQKIISLFGQQSYSDGKLNRPFLAEIVFKDEYKLAQLNALVHPKTILAADVWMEKQTSAYVIKEAALMFEAGAAAHLDYIIGVYAPQELRIKRVIQREHISREQVIARLDKQINETIKMKLCDYVVINDEQKMVIPQVLELHEKFIGLSK